MSDQTMATARVRALPVWLTALIAVAVMAPGTAHAQARLTYLTQSRGFISWVGIGPITYETYATNFNPFIGWSRLDMPNTSGIDSVGYASQRSFLNPDGIEFEATNFGTDGNFGPLGSGGGTSFLNVRFSVSEPTAIVCSTSFDAVGNSMGANWDVSLSSDDAVLWALNSDSSFNGVYPHKVVLQPGAYRFVITIRGGWMGEFWGDGLGYAKVSMKITDTGSPR